MPSGIKEIFNKKTWYCYTLCYKLITCYYLFLLFYNILNCSNFLWRLLLFIKKLLFSKKDKKPLIIKGAK